MGIDRWGRQADNAELRRLVTDVRGDSWDSAAGRDMLDALERRAWAWASRMECRVGLDYGTLDPRDLVTEAWFVLERYPQRVLSANCPWTYLWDAVRRRTAVAAAAAAVCSELLPESDMTFCRTLAAPIRIGAHPWTLERQLDSGPGGAHSQQRWSPALSRLLDILVRSGGDRALWADALDRAVEVLADARRSYEEHRLKRDDYLRETLGLQPKQLAALGALLIGTRRGNRAQQSLLLALHRDLTTSPDDVPGATARIAKVLGTSPTRKGRRRAQLSVCNNAPTLPSQPLPDGASAERRAS
jgi:hypothetical protein